MKRHPRLATLCGALLLSLPGAHAALEIPVEASAALAYNLGVQALTGEDLRTAEKAFHLAAIRGDTADQERATYNLGHVRFKQAVNALKDEKSAGDMLTEWGGITRAANAALGSANQALESFDIDQATNAYKRGVNVRRAMKKTLDDANRALGVQSGALARYIRADGDFRSAWELEQNFPDALHNAEELEKLIEDLKKQLQQLQQMQQQMQESREGLKKALRALRGMVPKEEQQPGDGEPDEEDEPQDQKEGKEKEQRTGNELAMTPAEAAALLESLRADGNRKLSTSENPSPGDRKSGDRIRKRW